MTLFSSLRLLPSRTRAVASHVRLMALYLTGPAEGPVVTEPRFPPRRPIVLLHGFGTSSRTLTPLQEHLRKTTGRVVVRIAISSGREDLRDSARRVNAVIERLAESPDFEYADVVAHSMGGLVATYLLKKLDRGCRVRNVVTLGTPHRGTPSAFIGVVALGLFCEAVWQMLPNSSLVRELKWMPVPDGTQLISISGSHDLLVPEAYTRLSPLPGQRNVRCESANHVQLLFSRKTTRLLRKALGRPGDDKLPYRTAA